MNINEQTDVFNGTVERMREIMFKKGNDYANDDRLSNFKLAGEISGLSAELNCLSLIATKVARLGVLLNSKNTANFESIDDTLLDLGNYAILLKMIRIDERPQIGNAVLADGSKCPVITQGEGNLYAYTSKGNENISAHDIGPNESVPEYINRRYSNIQRTMHEQDLLRARTAEWNDEAAKAEVASDMMRRAGYGPGASSAISHMEQLNRTIKKLDIIIPDSPDD